MSVRFVKCRRPGCTNSFLFKRGKMCCGDKGRTYWGRFAQAEANQKLFQAAVLTCPLDYPGARGLPADQWKLQGPQIAIAISVPEDAVGYRLGAPREGVEYHGKWAMKWFPNYHLLPRGVFSLRPFQFPAVPFPGDYLVAYFDKQHNLVAPPNRLVNISITSTPEPWSSGDDVMLLRVNKFRI